ncbi:hypothetical protein TNCV_4855741 [Trichonephila clavipes]|nr:hypothetical protein TNCV_4855741 [Trichonephila clavipes]
MTSKYYLRISARGEKIQAIFNLLWTDYRLLMCCLALQEIFNSSWTNYRLDVLPSSTGNFLLIVDGLQTFDVLPSSTGNFLLIVDGLQTFDVLPSSTGDSCTHRGRTVDLLTCCPAGAPNFLRSIDASAIFLVGTHMITLLFS